MRVFTTVFLASVSFMAWAQVDALVPFTSSNLPIVVINTDGLPVYDDPKITADMGIIDNGASRNKLTDPFNGFSGKIGIEIRGSSSQMFPKKQYGIELRDENGTGMAASLLGMPEEEDWILFAPYNDKTLMRDALAYSLGRKMGAYAPRTRFCEVVLNNVYQGVYVLIEKIKRDKNRVDIAKLESTELSGNDLTGGYIFKIDKYTGGNGEGWASAYRPPYGESREIYFQYDYPKPEDIAVEQKEYIKKYVNDFETALKGDRFNDPSVGYERYIDVNSFIDFFIMQELTKNVDGYRLSTYLYKKKDSDGGKLYMGPLWDFNLGFGNADYCTSGMPEGFVLEFNKVCAEDTWLIPFWWYRLFKDDRFGTRVADRWATLRATTLSEGAIHSYIDSVSTVLNAESQQRNFTAWKVLNKYVWPNYYVGPNFQAEITHLKQWVSERLIWMDQNMPALVTAVEKESTEQNTSVVPNPFHSDLRITYNISSPGDVSVRIYDSMGRPVETIDNSYSAPGEYNCTWQSGSPSGMYFYIIRQGTTTLGIGKVSKD